MSYFDPAELLATDEELKNSFSKLQNFRDVCNILKVTPNDLHNILFKRKDLYSSFEIPKKGTGTREILAPCSSLKSLQQKLNYIMNLVYVPKHPVHGYVKGRDIVTNARKHLNKNYILNFDLENFFPSINFGRVRGIFKGFFGMGEDAATIVANICCYKNSLPQGAPTSPIISNMICFQLDKEIQLLAKQNSCTYTRYADDLTISTTKKSFPKGIAFIGDSEVILAERLLKIIEDNGFKINSKKTRLNNRNQHLEVTGITVNEELNVNRNYIKKIRAILRCLETNSPEQAQKIFEEKYNFRHKKTINIPDATSVVKGMINFVGMVKGFDNSIFEKLAIRYNNIVGIEIFTLKSPELNERSLFVGVVELGYMESEQFYPEDQGSGFFLKDIGFITNAHVLQNYIEDLSVIKVHRSRYNNEMKKAKILACDKKRDIAILEVEGYEKSIGFEYSLSYELEQDIILLGYPNYGSGDSLYTSKGHLVQYRNHYMGSMHNEETGELGLHQERIIISSRIVGGNSGGPVINNQGKVIGVATKGFKDISPSSKDDSTAESIIVKVEDVLKVYKEKIAMVV